MTETDIRRLPDGSIDYRHYTRVGRKLHAQAVRDAVRMVRTGIAAGAKRAASILDARREAGSHHEGARWKPRYLA